jgi:hypothetical protein
MRWLCFLLFAPGIAITEPVGGDEPPHVSDAPPYFTVHYPPSTAAGQLDLGVRYTIWIPPGVKELRGVIVHQHGCGAPACAGGLTAAYDLHWQALARKWSCALLGPSYEQAETDDCFRWCDPRRGSDATFQKALADLSVSSRHPELARVPWALWGHSGGANWAGTMLLIHPDRIACVWLRSGSPWLLAGFGKGPRAEIPEAALQVPIVCNLGTKEQTGQFASIWTSTHDFFQEMRRRHAPAGLAIDPRTSHECGDSRYLAIPWIDACLALRLPEAPSDPLRPVALDTVVSDTSSWMPNDAVAQLWSEYLNTGATSDATPPPPPHHARLTPTGLLTWEADADFESGLAGFVIERQGKELARLPQTPRGPFGRPLFQTMSYHDTPEQPLPRLDFQVPDADLRGIAVRSINSVGQLSEAATATGP